MPRLAVRQDPFGLTGSTLEGRFRIEREVAEGGFGVVYYATQIALDRPVAIKVLKSPPGFTQEALVQFRDRFASEAKTIAKLRHPHIVDVHDFGVSTMPTKEIAPWMALEWIAGETLEEQLQRRRGHGGRSPAEVMASFRPILQAFAHAHRQGIVHRDIKPSNIMVVSTDAVPMLRVLDFGIAKLVAPDEAAGSGHTKTSGMPAFSPPYAAPEQIACGRTGPWTDVHALGLILTEMLTDQAPYRAQEIQLFEEIMATVRPTPKTKGVDVGGWEPVLRRAMALSPSERWRSAAELLAGLEENLDHAESGPILTRGGRDPNAGSQAARQPTRLLAQTKKLPETEAELRAKPAAPTPSRRGMWIAAGVAVLVAVGGALALRPRSAPRPAEPSAAGAPAPAAPEAPAPAAAVHMPAPVAPAVPTAPDPVAAPTLSPTANVDAASAAPAALAASASVEVRIEIRTDPPKARLTVDHQEVRNPYVVKGARNRRQHEITATLSGYADIHQMITFDRDREVVLKLPAVPERQPSVHALPATHAPGEREQTTLGQPAPASYRGGSKLKLETEFP